MKTIYAIASTALSRTVLIADQKKAAQFAQEQTDHTGRAHVAEPMEVHEDATQLNERIDQAHRDALVPTLNLGQRRAMGIPLPEKVPPQPLHAPAEDEA